MISDKDILWIIFAIFAVLIIVAAFGNMGDKSKINDIITFTAIGLIIVGILFVWFVLPALI
jgi:hypothetical protein